MFRSKQHFISAALAVFYLFTAISCSNDNDQNDGLAVVPDLFKLGELTGNGLTVEAYSEGPLTVGYHRIWFEVHRDGEQIERPEFSFAPMMHMEAHSHRSPFQSSGQERDPVHGLLETWAIFTMPSGSMGSWHLELTVSDPERGHEALEGDIQVGVDDSNRVITFLAENEERYVLTWIEPTEPVTGLNDLMVALHHRESMMNFPPVTEADIGFEPWMPSMDHGSSNNVDPTHQGNGFYEGAVNFNMTGDWELRFEIGLDGVDLGRHTFELEF